jgi:hypothetical protein
LGEIFVKVNGKLCSAIFGSPAMRSKLKDVSDLAIGEAFRSRSSDPSSSSSATWP